METMVLLYLLRLSIMECAHEIKFIHDSSEPEGVFLGVFCHVFSEILQRDPSVIMNLVLIDHRILFISPYKHMIIFIFDDAVVKSDLIGHFMNMGQLRVKAHFFREPSMHG